MDLNYLYYRQQVSVFMADNATSDEARRVYRDLADRYAAQIAQLKSPVQTMAAA